MSKAESAAVPVYELSDGRKFIAYKDALEYPEIMAFVKRFPTYWIPSFTLHGWIAEPREDD